VRNLIGSSTIFVSARIQGWEESGAEVKDEGKCQMSPCKNAQCATHGVRLVVYDPNLAEHYENAGQDLIDAQGHDAQSASADLRKMDTPAAKAHWDFVQQTAERVEQMPEWKQEAVRPASAGAKRPIARPCSACSAGDYNMEFHLHYPPFADDPVGETSSSNQPEKWVIEAGPITSEKLGEYITVRYSIRYPSGSFEVKQRVSDSKEGYAEAYERIARIVQVGARAEKDEQHAPRTIGTSSVDTLDSNYSSGDAHSLASVAGQAVTAGGAEQEWTCPECDGHCRVTAGGQNLVCYHCYLVGEVERLRQEKAQSDTLQGHFAKLASERWDRITELDTIVASLQGSHRVAEEMQVKLGKERTDREKAEGERDEARRALQDLYYDCPSRPTFCNCIGHEKARAALSSVTHQSKPGVTNEEK
jgi:hypothetical protein